MNDLQLCMFSVQVALYKLLQVTMVRDEELTLLQQQEAIREALS